jgi:hypothetical protein
VIVSKYGTLFAMAIMALIFGLAIPNYAFLQTSNLLAIVNQSALTAIIAVGLTLVLVVGEMDLSIGYAASLAGIIVAGLMAKQGLPMPAAILATLLMGGVIGTVNGLIVTKARVNAVVATLGVGTVLVGLSYGYTSGSPITEVPKGFANLTLGSFIGIQNPIWYMLAVLVVLWVILNRTPQKVVIARWLLDKPKVLILDEPSRGVDVGARAEVHRVIRELASTGTAILVISSDNEELVALCDRVVVLAEGRVTGELIGEDITEDRLLSLSFAREDEKESAP